MAEKIHWADVCAAEVDQNAAHRIATGITPSGPIHIGNMREVLTGDMVYKAIRDRGLHAELLYIADDFDPLRKVYPFLPDSYAQYVGLPVSDIPCPCGGHLSYAEHFLDPFLSALRELDVNPTVIRSSQEYRRGAYVAEIRRVLDHTAEIRTLLEKVSGRILPPDWSPFYPICKGCQKISSVHILGHDPDQHQVLYRCDCGFEGAADYSRGEGKLVWRVDWPMRWAHFGITVEPFGKDHAAAGGSYDTGKVIVRRVFGRDPPYPVMYEWISLKGRGEMHSSKGVVVTINEMLEIVPPEVLRYLIARTRPERTIDFDPGMGLLHLVDEYDRVAQEAKNRDYHLSRISSIPTRIPFRHIVTVVQIAATDEGVLQCLRRSGYDITDRENILQQAGRARVWLQKYAPPAVKFAVTPAVPDAVKTISTDERAALQAYLRFIRQLPEWKAEDLHNGVYTVAHESGFAPKKLFSAVYTAFLGEEKGPRLGWFLEALGRDFVVTRLEDAAQSFAE
ncbi:MAG: lysine--tRNA ligase [Methanomicrobiales archaeon]|nr:lysine--tRNA ligase [Methanomicrobiales archaeon]